MSGGVRLEVEGLTRWFGAHPALQAVSFGLEPGEFLVVLGPNGAGKTTLIKILARLLRPTLGRVGLDGEDWLSAPSERQAEVGMLSHSTYLYDGLTAIENLRFYARLYGPDPDRRAGAALAAVGLEAVADRRAGTLSRGQSQRLSIARAILHGPRLLLLDEPFAGLDPHAAARLGEALDGLSAEGRTIVLTTHDLDRVPAAAGRWLVLVDGRVVAAGARGETPELRLREAYERAVVAAEAAAQTRHAYGAA
jgi:heme exporter protein A